MANRIFTILIIGILFSCTKYLNKEEYSNFIMNPENGFRKTQVMDEFELSALYQPSEYFSVEEGKDVAQFEHFQFQIKLLDGKNILQYKETENSFQSERIMHFSFEAKNDFKLQVGTDTIPCSICHFSRNYNLTPTIDLSLAFKKSSQESEDIKLIYTDTQYNIGRVKFLFKRDDILNAPELKK